MTSQRQSKVVERYLALLDGQREKTFSALEDITDEQLWQRPGEGEWSIGEILHHNVLLIQSMFPIVRFTWRWFRWTGKLFKKKPYKTEIADPYKKQSFPHWVGFIWTPRYSKKNPVPFSTLLKETRDLHSEVRAFYERNEEDRLGHVYLFDPLFGFFNLIQTLKVVIYHDQLHYDDVIKQWHALRPESG